MSQFGSEEVGEGKADSERIYAYLKMSDKI